MPNVTYSIPPPRTQPCSAGQDYRMQTTQADGQPGATETSAGYRHDPARRRTVHLVHERMSAPETTKAGAVPSDSTAVYKKYGPVHRVR